MSFSISLVDTLVSKKKNCHALNQYGQHRFDDGHGQSHEAHEGEYAWRVEEESLCRFVLRGES